MQNRQCDKAGPDVSARGSKRNGQKRPRARRIIPMANNGEQNATPGYGSNYDGDPLEQPLAFSAPTTSHLKIQTFSSSIHYATVAASDNRKASQFTKPLLSLSLSLCQVAGASRNIKYDLLAHDEYLEDWNSKCVLRHVNESIDSR